MSPLNRRLRGAMIRGATPDNTTATLDEIVAAAQRDAIKLTRKLDRAAKRGTPVELTGREADVVLRVMRMWAER